MLTTSQEAQATAEKKRLAFLEELDNLLEKYEGAEIQIDSNNRLMEVFIPGNFDPKKGAIHEGIYISLGTWYGS